jgi:hypothetical protein
MALYDEDKASTFNTRAECQEWIKDRVIRFKLAMGNVMFEDGVAGLSQRKADGRILNIKSEGYKSGALDEPLKKYAKPVRSGTKWLAAMLNEK